MLLVKTFPCNNNNEARAEEEKIRIKLKAGMNSGRCYRQKGSKCIFEDCESDNQGSTDFCVKHGGGKRCSTQGCETAAQSTTEFCCKHGAQHTCLLCNTTISINSVKAHEKTKKHLANLEKV